MRHRGHKKAVVAVAHAMLVAAYHLLARHTTYHEPGANYYERRHADRVRQRAVQLLERQRYRATLDPAASAGGIFTAGFSKQTSTTRSARSAALTFTISNPAPTLSALAPSSVTAGGVDFALTVSGSGFVATSAVRWNGAARPTTFVSSTQLQVTIAASDIATAGTAQVTVVTPAPGGGTSAALAFTINNPAPTLSALAPSSVTAGGVDFTLTVSGSRFLALSAVQWNGAARPTTFASSTQLQITIAASDID